MKTHLLAATFTLLTPMLFAAESTSSAHMATSPTTPAVLTSSTEAFLQTNEKMHKAMKIAFTGDADIDFITGMIPHHQGAIEMAKTVIKHGKDPEVRMLANDIIKAQDKEIRWMQDWLELHGPNPALATQPATTSAAPDSMESQIKAAQQKVDEIEKRLEAKPTMPMLEDVKPTTSPTTLTDKATKIAEDMAKTDTQKLMAPTETSTSTVSATVKSLSEKLDEATQPLTETISATMPEIMEENPNTFRQPGMNY